MDFLRELEWWMLLVAASIFMSVYQVGRLGPQSRRRQQTQGIAGLMTMVFLVMAFVFTGWGGGLAVLVGMVLISMLAVVLLSLVMRALGRG